MKKADCANAELYFGTLRSPRAADLGTLIEKVIKLSKLSILYLERCCSGSTGVVSNQEPLELVHKVVLMDLIQFYLPGTNMLHNTGCKIGSWHSGKSWQLQL